MKKKIAIFVTACIFSFTVCAEQHDRNKGFDIKVTDLGDGLFQLRTDRSGNVGVLVGPDGVFMIDTQMEHLVNQIDSAQKELSGHRDVELVLNTHLHRDHVRGNAYFADKGAQIMAHPNVRKYLENSRAIVALKRDAPEVKPAYLPSIGVSTGTTVSMNGQTGYIYHTPNAHTDGDIFIHFKEANVIHAGDLLFSGRFPFIDIDNGGSVAGYIAGMEKVLETADENTRIIAGHGPISSEIHLEDNIKMLKETHEIIKALVDKGMSLKEIQQLNPLKDFTAKWEWAFITTDLMVQTHYYELTGRLEYKEQTKLVANEGTDKDFFGYSVALSGDTTVIGAFKVDDERGNDVGAAYVYTRAGTGWKLQAKLTASDGAPEDTFGGMSTIEGDTVVIGVIRSDDATIGEDTGSAYVFTRSDTEWTQQAKLTANDSAKGDSLGWSVGISGNILVVGAPRDDDKGKDSGSVYVFTRSENIWTQTAKLTADDGSEGDLFGISVAISRDTILVGADLNEEKGFNAGAAYVFIPNGDSWKQQAKLTADDGAEGDLFGVRVALEGNTALISARRDDHPDIGVDAGSAYVFTRSSAVWSQQAKLTAPDAKADDRFGRSIALSGDTALIGAMFQDSKGENAGAAYLYSRTGTTWKFKTKLTASDGAPGDVFGWAVALVGDTAVVSANRDDDKGESSGSAYIFDMTKK